MPLKGCRPTRGPSLRRPFLRACDQLHNVELRFKVRLWHYEAPSIGADALDIARNIPELVLPILEGTPLVGEDERPKEDLPDRIVRKYDADITLGTAEFGKPLQVLLGLYPAGEA